ncbi:sulfurtransferase complex subunit TusC [Shewanella sp. A14]
MKSLVIIFRHAPFGTTSTREGLDFAMLSASFEQQVSLVFTNEAILHLLAGQTPETAGSKDYISAFKALSLYDIDTVLVCEVSMTTLGLQPDDLSIPTTVVTSELITQTLQAADEVLVF